MLLGIDVGTTGAKAAVFDCSGNMLGYGFKEYGINCPQVGWAEQDPEFVWEKTKEVIKIACNGVGEKIKAVSLSVQGDAVIPIDKNRKAIGPAHLGMDYRATEQVKRITELIEERKLFEITGMRPHPMNSLVKIMWIRDNQPSIYKKAYKFVTYADFIMAKLGSDEIVIDYTMASRTMGFETSTKKWSKEILDKVEISVDKLATPIASGSIVGKIETSLAKELGIASTAVIVAGGHDQTCAALGAGVVETGTALDSHGTAEVLSICFPEMRVDGNMYNGFFPCYPHVVKDRFFTFALNHTGGILLKWYAEQFCSADAVSAKEKDCSVYEEIMKNLPEQPSSVMALPHFNGSGNPVCDLSSKGVILGLTMSTDRYQIAKAILESLSFEMRLSIEVFKELGIDIKRINCVGGGARSPIGLQLKADVLGMPVNTLKIRESACLGSALLAGIAIGVYSSVEEAVKVVKTAETYYPRKQFVEKYGQRFNLYKQLYPTLREFFAEFK